MRSINDQDIRVHRKANHTLEQVCATFCLPYPKKIEKRTSLSAFLEVNEGWRVLDEPPP
jgi:hypothetical protein